MNVEKKPLYTLIPIEDFKLLLGVDDREDKMSRFCLVTATFTIVQFCKRRNDRLNQRLMNVIFSIEVNYYVTEIS